MSVSSKQREAALNRKFIMDFIEDRKYRGCTGREIIKYTGFSSSTVYRHISALRQENKIEVLDAYAHNDGRMFLPKRE